VAELLLLALFDPVDPAPGADQALDVGGGAGEGEVEQLLLVVRGGDAGQGADLGVGDAAVAHGLGEARQVAEGAGDADMLAGWAEGEAGAPAEPVGAGAETPMEVAVPALALVELADEGEELVGGGGDLGGELGDPFAELFYVVARRSGAGSWREGREGLIHGVLQRVQRHCKPMFFKALDRFLRDEKGALHLSGCLGGGAGLSGGVSRLMGCAGYDLGCCETGRRKPCQGVSTTFFRSR
jgi:hypothetical protein